MRAKKIGQLGLMLALALQGQGALAEVQSVVLNPTDLTAMQNYIADSKLHMTLPDGTSHPLVDGAVVLQFLQSKQGPSAGPAAPPAPPKLDAVPAAPAAAPASTAPRPAGGKPLVVVPPPKD